MRDSFKLAAALTGALWASSGPAPLASVLAATPLLGELETVGMTPPTGPGIVRSRFVGIDTGRLPSPDQTGRHGDEALVIDLFPDLSVKAVFERFDPNSTGVTWVGYVPGVFGSHVTLVHSRGLLHGSVIMPSGAYSIRPASEDERSANTAGPGPLHVVLEIDQGALPREAEPLDPGITEEDLRSARDVAQSDSGDIIEVMVVYTAAAQQHAGGPTGIVNLINLGISETNASYANSDVRHRVRLVHSALVSYTETSSFSTSLTTLRAGSIAGVAALREQYRADLVAMLVHPSQPDACGIAYVMTNVSAAFAPSGYSVTDTNCVSPGLTLAHEWGHNMGAQHDWYVSAAVAPYTYAHGYANPRPGQRWRTIMAYNDICTSQGFSCSRLVAWANPDFAQNPLCTRGGFNCRSNLWHIPGEPMGVRAGTRSNCAVGVIPPSDCDADDHRALNNTASTIANFRASLTPSSVR